MQSDWDCERFCLKEQQTVETEQIRVRQVVQDVRSSIHQPDIIAAGTSIKLGDINMLRQ